MSALEDLYREIILDHYRSPRNRGELETPPAHRVEGFNPLCGDEVVLYLQLGDDGSIDLRVGGQGCSISQSSASMMSAAVKGCTPGQARQLIKRFKSMMSIHESALGSGDGRDGADGRPGAEWSGDGGLDDGDAAGRDLSDLGELAALQGVVKFPVRIKCATLSWNALAQGLDELSC